jgi:hypothetical protein
MKHFCSFTEAIREADGLLPQSFMGPGARALLKTDSGKVCALEAGLITLSSLPTADGDLIYSTVERLYPYLAKLSNCPRCDEERGEALVTLIWHLNDEHHLSFGQIADWLESEEEKLGYVTVVESETVNTPAKAERALSGVE